MGSRHLYELALWRRLVCSMLVRVVTFMSLCPSLSPGICVSAIGIRFLEKMTDALITRLIHKGYTIEFVGESYHFRYRLQQAEHAGELMIG